MFQQVKIIKIKTLENDGIYSFGRNGDGQLGIGNKDNQSTPQRVKFFDKMKIKEISCGKSHTIISTGNTSNISENVIFSFGENGSGQLGIGKNTKDDLSIPQEIKFFYKMKIKQISCGSNHTLVLTSKKFIF